MRQVWGVGEGDCMWVCRDLDYKDEVSVNDYGNIKEEVQRLFRFECTRRF
jgi:hypothetical protein